MSIQGNCSVQTCSMSTILLSCQFWLIPFVTLDSSLPSFLVSCQQAWLAAQCDSLPGNYFWYLPSFFCFFISPPEPWNFIPGTTTIEFPYSIQILLYTPPPHPLIVQQPIHSRLHPSPDQDFKMTLWRWRPVWGSSVHQHIPKGAHGLSKQVSVTSLVWESGFPFLVFSSLLPLQHSTDQLCFFLVVYQSSRIFSPEMQWPNLLRKETRRYWRIVPSYCSLWGPAYGPINSRIVHLKHGRCFQLTRVLAKKSENYLLHLPSSRTKLLTLSETISHSSPSSNWKLWNKRNHISIVK